MSNTLSVLSQESEKVLNCSCSTTQLMSSFPYFRAVRFCDLHAKQHGKHMLVETAFIDNMPHHEATEGDIEKIATYLLKGNVSTAGEIVKALGLDKVIVAISLEKLVDKGIVGCTPHKPHKFFFNP